MKHKTILIDLYDGISEESGLLHAYSVFLRFSNLIENLSDDEGSLSEFVEDGINVDINREEKDYLIKVYKSQRLLN